MSISTFLEESVRADPSWGSALEIVRKTVTVPSHVARLFKGGWNRQIDPGEYLKVMGFSRLNPICLLDAAEFDFDTTNLGRPAIEQAITYLGIRHSAVVLAINLLGRIMLKNDPPPSWRKLYKDVMTSVEVGYRFGSRVPEVGLEGGSLMGFSRHCGLMVLMSAFPNKFKTYGRSATTDNSKAADTETGIFGCAGYQVGALTLQQLGFGTEVALGAAFGMVNLRSPIPLEHDAKRWRATSLWIDSLVKGRNFPADLEVRNLFPEVMPASGKERNMTLEVLYTEVAKAVQGGSNWTWHLPRPSYEATEEFLTEKTRGK